MTGMPAATIARTRESIAPAPSSFTASAPASFTKRIAFSIASSSETWNEPNGMSAITSGRLRAARHGAREDEHLLHRRGHRRVVAEHGHRRRVADEDEVGARLVGEAPARRVVGGDHDDRLPPRLHLGELGDRELAGRRCGGSRPLRADAHCVSPSSDDVVDEAGRADADGAGEDGRVEVGDLDVVDLEAVRGRELRERGLAIAGREGAGERERRGAFLRREQRVARGEREPVGVADGRHDAQLHLEREVADQPPDHLDLLCVLLSEVDARRAGRS